MRTIERNIVTAVIYSADGKILQAFQDPNGGGAYPGHWAIIGGGVEQGEDQRSALNREIKEETGMDVSSYAARLIDRSQGEADKTLKDTGERVHCRMEFYTYEIIINDKKSDMIEIQLDREHTKCQWSDPSELKNLELTPPSVELFTKLGYL